MNQEQCELLQAILKIKGVQQFRKALEQFQDEKIQFLLECFLNAEQLAKSKKDQVIVNKHKKVFTAAKKVFTIKQTKVFLKKNFPVLKKIVASFVHSVVCGTIATAIVSHYG